MPMASPLPFAPASLPRSSFPPPVPRSSDAAPKPFPTADRKKKKRSGCLLGRLSSPSFHSSPVLTLRRRRNQPYGVDVKVSASGFTPSSEGDDVRGMVDGWEEAETSTTGPSFLAKIAIALGIAATVTLISICTKWSSSGSSFKMPLLVDGSSQSIPAAFPDGFSFTIFGYRIIIPEHTPGGVCISDLIPFYAGKYFSKSKASTDICTKLGIGKEKAVRITRAVQKYGNLVGFVERFSVGVRNPTAFLAGAWGISSECFFAGVCCGGLITVPIQLAIGFLLRERPAVAIASVATIVGIWTVFPYLVAASTALFLFIRQRRST